MDIKVTVLADRLVEGGFGLSISAPKGKGTHGIIIKKFDSPIPMQTINLIKSALDSAFSLNGIEADVAIVVGHQCVKMLRVGENVV